MKRFLYNLFTFHRHKWIKNPQFSHQWATKLCRIYPISVGTTHTCETCGKVKTEWAFPDSSPVNKSRIK